MNQEERKRKALAAGLTEEQHKRLIDEGWKLWPAHPPIDSHVVYYAKCLAHHIPCYNNPEKPGPVVCLNVYHLDGVEPGLELQLYGGRRDEISVGILIYGKPAATMLKNLNHYMDDLWHAWTGVNYDQ